MNEVEFNNAIRSIERKAEVGDLPMSAAYMSECEQTVAWVSAVNGKVGGEESFATIHERWFDEDLRMQPTNAGSVTSTSGGFGIRR